jgi:hypothetical protein
MSVGTGIMGSEFVQKLQFEGCAKLSCRVRTQSHVVQHAVEQICLTVYGAL